MLLPCEHTQVCNADDAMFLVEKRLLLPGPSSTQFSVQGPWCQECRTPDVEAKITSGCKLGPDLARRCAASSLNAAKMSSASGLSSQIKVPSGGWVCGHSDVLLPCSLEFAVTHAGGQDSAGSTFRAEED